jgi:DNA polymerase V
MKIRGPIQALAEPDRLEIINPCYTVTEGAPYFSVGVEAGFPSPADNHVDRNLDLNEYLIDSPAATYFVRVSGDSMIGAGIHDKDLLIVDRSLEAKHGSVIIAVVSGEFTIKRLQINSNKQITLVPENRQHASIEITAEMEFQVWGVVTNVIHSLR